MKYCRVWVYYGLGMEICGEWYVDGACPIHGTPAPIAPKEAAARAAEQLRKSDGD